MRDIFSFGVGGLVVASLYQTLSLFWKKNTYRKLELIQTECLHDETRLNRTFVDLEICISSMTEDVLICFRRAADAADRLVFLRFQLEKHTTVPTVEDRINGYLQLHRCETSLRSLLTIVESNSVAKEVVYINRILSQISDILAAHMSAIMMLTHNI